MLLSSLLLSRQGLFQAPAVKPTGLVRSRFVSRAPVADRQLDCRSLLASPRLLTSLSFRLAYHKFLGGGDIQCEFSGIAHQKLF